MRTNTPADHVALLDPAIARAYLYPEALDRRVLGALNPALTTAQYHALVALHELPRASLNDLAARLLSVKSNASGIVDRLMVLGLVDRTRDRDDGRRVCLSLTASGEAVLGAAHQARRAALVAALAPLAPDLADIERAFDLLTAALEHAALRPIHP